MPQMEPTGFCESTKQCVYALSARYCGRVSIKASCRQTAILHFSSGTVSLGPTSTDGSELRYSVGRPLGNPDVSPVEGDQSRTRQTGNRFEKSAVTGRQFSERILVEIGNPNVFAVEDNSLGMGSDRICAHKAGWTRAGDVGSRGNLRHRIPRHVHNPDIGSVISKVVWMGIDLYGLQVKAVTIQLLDCLVISAIHPDMRSVETQGIRQVAARKSDVVGYASSTYVDLAEIVAPIVSNPDRRTIENHAVWTRPHRVCAQYRSVISPNLGEPSTVNAGVGHPDVRAIKDEVLRSSKVFAVGNRP